MQACSADVGRRPDFPRILEHETVSLRSQLKLERIDEKVNRPGADEMNPDVPGKGSLENFRLSDGVR